MSNLVHTERIKNNLSWDKPSQQIGQGNFSLILNNLSMQGEAIDLQNADVRYMMLLRVY